jgi:hypothetical protein
MNRLTDVIQKIISDTTPTEGANTPVASAERLGELFIKTTEPKEVYIAVNTGTGASDWRKIT